MGNTAKKTEHSGAKHAQGAYDGVKANAKRESNKLRRRHDASTADPQIMHGQPCVAGTRIPVSVVLDCLAGGMTEDEILKEYPTLSKESIRSCLAVDR